MATDKSWYSVIKKGHFILLGLLLLNFLLKHTLGFHMRESIAFGLKLILYVSGIGLFVIAVRPLKKLAFYYVLYPLSVLIMAAFYCFGGIPLAVLASLAYAPVAPERKAFDNGELRMYEGYHGFLGACCDYTFEKPVLFLFEQRKSEYSGSDIEVIWDAEKKVPVIKPKE